MESDDDFLAPSQFGRPHFRIDSTNRSQAVTSSSTNRSTNRSQAAYSQPGPSQMPQSQQIELSQIQDGLKFLMERVQQFSGDSRGIKRPAEQKPMDKNPNTKEECQLCHKLYANKTTLFRHYRAIHQEMNPEKYHGCSMNNTIVSLDVSFREILCPVCGYVAVSQSALDAHTRITHSNEANLTENSNVTTAAGNVNSNKENISNNGITNIKDKMHKCEECACYFEERKNFDEHMKIQHGFEIVCKICNKNLLFKDIDGHVKDHHPNVYNRKGNEDKIEKIIVEKVMKNKKGNRVHVFICTRCDLKMFTKTHAEKHARSHKKGLKMKVAPRNKARNAEENFKDDTTNSGNVILTCFDCDISTGSYDAAVEHSQNHITNKSNNLQFVTQTCLICELKFEPLCYKTHVDLHYKNKAIHRGSFKYFKYKSKFLFSEYWFNCFDMAEPLIKCMISESIYEHTRSVKMRVVNEGNYKLYKCSKCQDYVDPAAVYNHAVNYDTCLKVKCSYMCDICNRKFNSRLARSNHKIHHKSEDSYKIVLFNHENDKEFNDILNDPKIRLNSDESHNSNEIISKDNHTNVQTRVLYKCLCGLCFVQEENADIHKKKCPGKDTKQSCPKCNNLFNPEELLAHCFEHHLNETQIVIENISPDVIVIESDGESENKDDGIITIDSSDDEDAQNEDFNNTKIKVLPDNTMRIQCSSTGEMSRQNTNELESVATKAALQSVQLIGLEAITNGKRNVTDEVEFNGELVEPYGEMSDHSQDTISDENADIDTNGSSSDINKHDTIKCVPPSQLLNPVHYDNEFLKVIGVGLLNTQINADIETVRKQIETATSTTECVPIKEEKPWLFDPTDFSNICKRPSLRQIEMFPTSSYLIQEVDSVLTDDEETQFNEENAETEVFIQDGFANGNISNNALTLRDQILNVFTEANTIVDLSHISNQENIPQNLTLEKTEMADKNKSGYEKGLEIRNTICQEVTSNNSLLNTEIENSEMDESDDELFLPSGNEIQEKSYAMEIDTNEKGMSKENYVESETRQLVDNENYITSDVTISGEETENADDDNFIADEVENNDNIASANFNDDPIITDDITNKEKVDSDNIEYDHITEENEDTINVVAIINVSTNNSHAMTEPDVPPRDQNVLIRNIKQGLASTEKNIKRELIAENAPESMCNGCDKDNLVHIKVEPKDLIENGINENKENAISVIKNNGNIGDDNYNHCSVV